jgi:ABC-type branched-subunit amino acid transport system substrate-binding protein
MNKIFLCLLLISFKCFSLEVKVGALIGNKKPGIEKTEYTEKFYDALILAQEFYKKDLKASGIKINLSIYEMKDDPITNYYPIKKAIANEVDVLIGPSTSYYIPGIYLALKDVKNKVVVVSPYSVSPLILKTPKMTSMLDITNDFNGMLMDFLSRTAKDKPFKVICAEDLETSKDHCDGLDIKFKRKGAYIRTDKNVSNIDEIVNNILKSKVKIVITPNRIPISGILIRELVAKGYKGIFVGSSALGEILETGLLDVVGHKNFQAVALRQNSVHDLSYLPKYQKVVKALTEKWGHPRLTSLLFFDAMAMVIESILLKKNSFKENIVLNDSYSGLISNRRTKSKIYRAISIENGRYSLIGRYEL